MNRLGTAGALVALGVVAAGIVLERTSHPPPMPAFDDVRAHYETSEATLLDRNGAVLQTLRTDYTARRLEWTPLASISPALPAAVIAAEDRRFLRHGGVDFAAVLGAIRDRALHRSRRGASTLEMQLAAQLEPSLRADKGRRGWLQKLRQMRAARTIGATWTKDDVLEAYLNLVGLRGETQGIAAASQSLFAKPPAGLDADEAWTIAALLPAPGASPATVARRACAISHREGAACDELRRVTIAALESPTDIANGSGLAPHLARRLLRAPGERVTTTLDGAVQRIARTALDGQLRRLDALAVRDGAAVVLDNATGDVLAYVGSAGRSSRAAQVDGVRAARQAGSTLKPFLYSLAIERGYLTAASLLDDAPVALEAGPGLYLPQNYEHDFKGLVSVRTALAGSLNIPAVRTLILAGVEPFRERLHQLGYVDGLTESGEYYGFSLALGSAEVSLLEQANAYRALANGGRWSPTRLKPDDAVAQPRQVVDTKAAWIVSDILADRGARAVTFDLDGPLSTSYWSAVKTGTSKNLRDNWCIGFTRRYTIAVWVGNFEGDPMRTVSGITGAAPAWREIADALEAGGADRQAPPAPADVVRTHVHFVPGVEPDRDEWFVAGTQTTTVAAVVPVAARARIASPADGSLIALDPDIPLDRQHVLLRAEPASSALRLRLDARDLGAALKPRFWTPLPGEHELALVDSAGKALDTIRFSVRGVK